MNQLNALNRILQNAAFLPTDVTSSVYLFHRIDLD